MGVSQDGIENVTRNLTDLEVYKTHCWWGEVWGGQKVLDLINHGKQWTRTKGKCTIHKYWSLSSFPW